MMSHNNFFFYALFLILLVSDQQLIQLSDAVANYSRALTMSILYFEAQRSGKLPDNQRVQWRGDSGLHDGSLGEVDLVGGYYDAGDNVKFGFPLAFTITTLSWSVVDFSTQLQAKGELQNALGAIRWGTDYLLKASSSDGILYGQVGDGDSDHSCWQRPEDMTTPRDPYKIDTNNPGSDLAGETAAALAAASMAFWQNDAPYSGKLLDRAKKLFDFATIYQGIYSDSITVAQNYYKSSGFQDEILWAAAWLYRASGEETYLEQLANSGDTGDVRTMFSWDDKYFGVQTLISKLILKGKLEDQGKWNDYKSAGDKFLCNIIQKGDNNVKMSPGGMLWWGSEWNNLQYTTAALLALSSYVDDLESVGGVLPCYGYVNISPDDIKTFALYQLEYILGSNPRSMSYLVGYGPNYPLQVHHRGASIVSIKQDPKPVDCKAGFDQWYNKNAPNPNILVGAVVGGPNIYDQFLDTRNNFKQQEPATANTAPLVGVLAKFG